MSQKMIIYIVFVVIAILAISGLLYVNGSNDNSDKHLNISEFYNLVFMELDAENHTSTLDYLTYDDGDEIVIRDTIYEIEYNTFPEIIDIVHDFNHSQTIVSFFVDDSLSLRFYFMGDITDEFKVNDTVEIRFHVQKINYSMPSLTTNYTIIFIHDTAVEGFDQLYYQSFRKVLMPRETITKIS